jgi:hypothetical protein
MESFCRKTGLLEEKQLIAEIHNGSQATTVDKFQAHPDATFSLCTPL